MESTDNCTMFFAVFGATVFAEFLILLNIHRFVKIPEKDLVMSGGKVQSGLNRVQLLRVVLGISLIAMIGMFAFFLSQQGCLG